MSSTVLDIIGARDNSSEKYQSHGFHSIYISLGEERQLKKDTNACKCIALNTVEKKLSRVRAIFLG